MLTIQEVADKLRVSRETIRKVIIKGDLKALKIGTEYRIQESDFQEYLESIKIRKE